MVAGTREKFARTHDPRVKCLYCKRLPRIRKTKKGVTIDPLHMVIHPSGRPVLAVCSLCLPGLKARGWTVGLKGL